MRLRVPFLLVAALALLTAASPIPADGRATILFQGVDPQGTENDSLFVADADGGHPRELLATLDGDLLHPDWSPDGRSIVFAVDGRTIDVASATGRAPRAVVTCAAACVGLDFPSWSPDGRSIAYTRYVEPGVAGPPASSVIVVQDLQTGREREVAHSSVGQLVDVPRWSPDGTRLVIGIDRFDADGNETGSAIAVVGIRSRSSHRLTAFALYAYSPDWNRRTGELVFSRETRRFATTPVDGPLDLYGIRPDGTHLRRITHLHGDRTLFQPAFAADGRSILATLDEPGARRGVRVDITTGRIHRLGTPALVMTHLKDRR